MFVRELFSLAFCVIPIATLWLLWRCSRRLTERLAGLLGMALGTIGGFQLIISQLSLSDSGTPFVAIIGAVLFGLPIGGWLLWGLVRIAGIVARPPGSEEKPG
jgi:hypothetical protein